MIIVDGLMMLVKSQSNNGRLELIERRTGVSRRRLRRFAWQGLKLTDEETTKVRSYFQSKEQGK